MNKKNFKALLARIMVLALIINMLLPQSIISAESLNLFAGGDGTENSPYQIATAQQLKTLGELINDPSTSEAFNCGYYELTNDLDFTGITDWTPIGNVNTLFGGNFEGNNHVISNLIYSNANIVGGGVFGVIEGATIKNLGVVDCSFTSVTCVGGVTGVIMGSDMATTIENCYVKGSIKANDVFAGGIVGYICNLSDNNVVNIKNCYSMGEVVGGVRAGGIIGGAVSGAEYFNVNVSYCYSTAKVTANDYVGGIVGDTIISTGSAISIKNCMALNEEINVTGDNGVSHYGRIVSYEHNVMTFMMLPQDEFGLILNGNRGLQNMTANIFDGFDSWSNDDTDKDGKVVSKLQVSTPTFWTDTSNWYENGWNGFTFEYEKLPGFGTTMEFPQYLELSGDFTSPTVIKVVPQNGETGISEAGDIVITFSEAMNDAVYGNVILNGVPINAFGTWSDEDTDGDVETYTIPYTDLAKDFEFNMVISGFEDLEGNLMDSNSDYSFFTVSGSDSLKPTVNAVYPINNQTNVPINGDIVITFSEKMNTNFGTILLNDVTISKENAVWTQDGTVYTIPYANLTYNNLYDITISGFKDLAGNVMIDDINYDFTTAVVGADIVKPTVKSVTPVNGATNVSLGTGNSIFNSNDITYIAINFSEIMDIYNTGTVKLNGVTIDNSYGTFDPMTNNGVTYYIPYGDLSPNTKYTITIEDFTDKAGNKMNSDSTYSFTTATIGADTIKPTIKKVTPGMGTPVASNGMITVKFSEEMDTTAGSIYLGGIQLNETGKWSIDNTTYSIPYKNLTEGGVYGIIIKDFKDKAGNVIESMTQMLNQYIFVVADEGAPVVLDVEVDKTVAQDGTTPDGLSFDPTDGVILIRFSEVVTPGEVLLNGVRLSTAAGNFRMISPGLYEIGYAGLSIDTAYNITIQGFVDLQSTMMPLNNEFNFTTVDDDIEPDILFMSPEHEEIGVPTSGEIVIHFDEAMDTSFAGKVNIVNTYGGTTLLGKGVWSDSGYVYTVSYTGLLKEQSYEVQVFNFRDLSGNVMYERDWEFLTSSGSDLIKPTVVNIIPENGSTGIEIENGYIQITFSEKMDARNLDIMTPEVYDLYQGKVILNNVTLTRVDEDVTVTDHYGWEDDGLITYRIPLPKLAYDTTYTIVLKDFKDYSGNKMEEISYTFKTVSEIDNLKPTVVTMTPEKDSLNAPINGNIVINFSEEMDANILGLVSLNGNSINASSGTWTNNNTTFIVSYPNLLNDKKYVINVSDFKDLAGNTMTPIINADDHNFTTVKAGFDIYKPTVTLVSPKANAERVDIKGKIKIIFSEKMNDTVGKVYLNGTALSGTSSWSGNNSVYEIEYSGLAKDKVYTVSIQGFKDVAGNTMDNYKYTFTSISQDTTKPVVLSTIPANNGKEIPTEGDLVITFSEGMKTLDENGNQIGTISWKDGFEIQGGVWSNGNSTLTIPYEILSGREYTIAVQGFKDKAGNVMDETYEFTFNTESLLVKSIDFKSKSETLVNGNVNYHTKGSFDIVFEDAMKANTGTVNLIEQPVTELSTPIELTGVWSSDNLTYTVSYDQLNNDKTYSIILENFADKFNNKMKNYYGEFTTASKAVVSGVTPLNGATVEIAGNIVVSFDKVMDKNTSGSVKLGSVTLNSAGGSWSADGKTYTIAYSGLANSTQYTITIEGFKDSLGSTIVNNSANSFTTVSNPTITSVTPLNNADKVSLSGNITINFDRVMDKNIKGTVKLNSYILNSTNSSWSSDGKTYTIPYTGLSSSTQYTINIEGFKDSYGSSIEKNSTNKFTTVEVISGDYSGGAIVFVDTNTTYNLVTFNYNYDDSTDKTQKVVNNTKLSKPTNPTRSGYDFEGWYTDKSCENQYNFEATVNSDIVLYANWSVATKTPTADKKAGTYVNSVKVTLTNETQNARIYYTLDGTKPTTSSKYVLSGKTITISKTSTLRFMSSANNKNSAEGTQIKYTIKTANITTSSVPKNSTGSKDRTITLTAPANTTLYYSIGTISADKTSTPTTKSKSVKPGKTVKITITKDTYVKVMAVKSGCAKSNMVTRTYKIK